jgi:hypothetical protein
MVRPLTFLLVRRLLDLLRLGPTPDEKDVEIVVLRHQLAVSAPLSPIRLCKGSPSWDGSSGPTGSAGCCTSTASPPDIAISATRQLRLARGVPACVFLASTP